MAAWDARHEPGREHWESTRETAGTEGSPEGEIAVRGRTRGRHVKARTRRAAAPARIVVLLVAVAVVGLVVVLVTRPSPPHGGGPAASTHRHLASLSTDAPTTTSSLATTSTVPTAAPVFDRVLVVGDSLGLDLGYQLYDHLEGDDVVTTLAAVGDTGLANTSYYDWPAHLETLLDTYHPSLVVIFLGANDDQGLYAGATAVAPGSAAWDSAYAPRVHAMLSEATAAGATVAWVGMPPMSDPTLDSWMGHIDGIFERQSARFRRAIYVSSDAVLGTSSGGYQPDGPDGTQWRTPDGVHLTSQGASVLATAVIAAVAKHDPAPAQGGRTRPR